MLILSFITLIGIIGIISGVLQIFFSEFIFKMKIQGIRSPKAIKNGGYITIVAGILFIILDVAIMK